MKRIRTKGNCKEEMIYSRYSCCCRQALTGSWSGQWPAEKEEVCGSSTEWARESENRCTHSTCKRGLCKNQNTKQTVGRVGSGANENNGIVVQASRQSSINNDKATSPFQIPWHHNSWQRCNTSCNCDSTTSSPFGHSYDYMTRYDGRTTNQRCNDYDCCEKMKGVFDGTNKIKLERHHQCRL